jgi:hypothetical protein
VVAVAVAVVGVLGEVRRSGRESMSALQEKHTCGCASAALCSTPEWLWASTLWGGCGEVG